MPFGFRIIPSTSSSATVALLGKATGMSKASVQVTMVVNLIAKATGMSFGKLIGKGIIPLLATATAMAAGRAANTVVLALKGKAIGQSQGQFNLMGFVTLAGGKITGMSFGRLSPPVSTVFLQAKATGMSFMKTAASFALGLSGKAKGMGSAVLGQKPSTIIQMFGRATGMLKAKVELREVQQIIPQFRNFTPGLIKAHQAVTLVKERVSTPALRVLRKILPGLKD